MRTAVAVLLFLSCILNGIAASINFTPNQLEKFPLQPGTQTIKISDITKEYTHIIVEVHSSANLHLSSTEHPQLESSVNGSHVGLLLFPKSSSISLYISSDRSTTIDCWLRVNTFQSYNPIPGACNTEFNPRIDPNIHIIYQNLSNSPWYYHVDFALGNVRQQLFDCGNMAVLNSTQYHLYAIPLRICGGGSVINVGALDSMQAPLDKDADGVKVMKKLVDMTSASSILQTADYLGSFSVDSSHQLNGAHPPRFRVLRRKGAAYIVSIVMEYREKPLGTSYYAAYVPTVVDECYEHADCLLIPGMVAKGLAVVVFIVGLTIAFFGHCMPRLYGAFCFILLVGMIGVPAAQNIDGFQHLGIATLVLLGGVLPLSALCMFLCCIKRCKDMDRLIIVPPAVLFALLINATLFFTPLNKLSVFQSYSWFCGVVASITAVLSVLFIYFKEMTLVYSSMAIGSCISLCSVSSTFLIGSVFHYVVIDQYLRFAQPITLTAVVYAPLGLADLLMFTAWGVVIILVSPIIHCTLSRRRNRARRRNYNVCDEDRLSESTLRSTVGWLERNTNMGAQHAEDQFFFDRDSAALHSTSPVNPSAPLRPPSYLHYDNYGTYGSTVRGETMDGHAANSRAGHGPLDERPPAYDTVTTSSRVVTITTNA